MPPKQHVRNEYGDLTLSNKKLKLIDHYQELTTAAAKSAAAQKLTPVLSLRMAMRLHFSCAWRRSFRSTHSLLTRARLRRWLLRVPGGRARLPIRFRAGAFPPR